MQEDIWPALVGRDEAEAAIRVEELDRAVERPLDGAAVAVLEAATARATVLVAAAEVVAGRASAEAAAARCGRRRLRGGGGIDLVNRDDLQAAAAFTEIGDDGRAGQQILLVQRADRRDMQENVARTVDGRGETEPLFGVEPFDFGFDIFVRDERLGSRRLATIEHGASGMSDREHTT